MAGHDMDAPQSSSRQSLDEEVPQPPSPALMRFPSAVSTPVSPLDLIAMEELRKKARAGGADKPGRYGFYGDPDATTAALAASQAAMEEGHADNFSPAPKATFNVEHPHEEAEEPQDIPLIHVAWQRSASPELKSQTSGLSFGLFTPQRSMGGPRKSYPTPEKPTPPYSDPQKQKGSGLLSAPRRRWEAFSERCSERYPKPFTILVATLAIALVLIIGFMIGHFAAPYFRTMTFMQPPGSTAADMAPFSGVGTSDSPGTVGAGIGLETDEPITRDQSPTAARNPYLDRVREGSGSGSGSGFSAEMPIRRERSGSPNVPAVTPGGV